MMVYFENIAVPASSKTHLTPEVIPGPVNLLTLRAYTTVLGGFALSSSNRTPPSMHYSAWGRFAFQWPILDLRVAQFDQFLNLGPQGITQLLLGRLIFVFEGKFVEIGLVAVLRMST